jgi:AcrR family transcriptional regulator
MKDVILRVSDRADARANRARVLEAAREAFREHGIAAEMKDLADRADVGVGTIYRNFPSKEDLILALLKDVLAATLADIATAHAAADPIQGLRYLLRREAAGVQAHGWLFEGLLSGQIPPRCRAVIRAELEEHDFARRYLLLVQRAVVCGRLRPDLDIEVAAATLSGTLSPMNRDALPDRKPEDIADAVLAEFLRGAAPPMKKKVLLKGEAVTAY